MSMIAALMKRAISLTIGLLVASCGRAEGGGPSEHRPPTATQVPQTPPAELAPVAQTEPEQQAQPEQVNPAHVQPEPEASPEQAQPGEERALSGRRRNGMPVEWLACERRAQCTFVHRRCGSNDCAPNVIPVARAFLRQARRRYPRRPCPHGSPGHVCRPPVVSCVQGECRARGFPEGQQADPFL